LAFHVKIHARDKLPAIYEKSTEEEKQKKKKKKRKAWEELKVGATKV
jgi:hypothetical protein